MSSVLHHPFRGIITVSLNDAVRVLSGVIKIGVPRVRFVERTEFTFHSMGQPAGRHWQSGTISQRQPKLEWISLSARNR